MNNTMSQVQVTFRRAGQAIESILDLINGSEDGVLTTNHAASSHGLPVVVDANGQALGPAEIEGDVVVPTYLETDDEAARNIHRELSEDEIAMIVAARAAGYRVVAEAR